jgi:hypothetical protein
VSGTSPKLLQLLRKRLRQLLRVVVVLAACVAVAATALAIWWLNSLNGLPDIGDPFDVAAFRAFRLPDEQNAFTYLRRASEKLTPIRGLRGRGFSGSVRVVVRKMRGFGLGVPTRLPVSIEVSARYESLSTGRAAPPILCGKC